MNNYFYDAGVVVTPQVTPTNVLGRLAHATSPTGEVFFSYDGLGRVNARTFTDASASAYVEKRTFHGDGSPSSLELDLPDHGYQAEQVDYGYDSAGRPRSMLFSDGTSSQPLYQASTVDPFGRIRAASFGNTSYAANYADVGRRLFLDYTVSSSQGTRHYGHLFGLANGSQPYDAVGRELSRTEIKGIGSTGPMTTYAYDALGRLASTLVRNGATTQSSRSFSYDPLGNTLALGDEVGTADAALSYLYTDRDRICRIGYGDGGLGGIVCNVLHDGAGNVIQQPTRTGGTRTLDYFNSGGVRSIADSSGAQASFRYDPFGQVQELDVVGGTSGDQRHDRRYGGLIAWHDQVSGGAMTSVLSRQFPGPGITITRRGASGPWLFQFGEPRGGRFTTDQNGAFVQDLDYAPFGEAASSGAPPGAPQYSSEQWNGGDALAAFGLVHLGARLYDPVIGRFLSRDPLLVPRTSTTTNPYAFASNDPINSSDPSGLDPCAADGSSCISAGSNDEDHSSALGGVGGWFLEAASRLAGMAFAGHAVGNARPPAIRLRLVKASVADAEEAVVPGSMTTRWPQETRSFKAFGNLKRQKRERSPRLSVDTTRSPAKWE